jgi:UDP-glucose:(heptosyl)LPS alpha-1,3-glucosyltransferase
VPGWRRVGLRKRQAFAAAERRIVERGASIIALSSQQRAEAIEHLGARSEQVKVIFNGIDLARFTPPQDPALSEARARLGLDHREVMVLFIGQDFARKGLDRLLAGIRRADDARFKLHVVGQGNPIEAPFATYHGPMSDVRPMLHAADMLALPSRSDPFGLVALEAMACGIPAIVSRACGVAEAMTDGVHGSVVDNTDDPDAWADAIRQWIEPAPRHAARQSLMTHRSRLGIEAHVDAVVELYQRRIDAR